MIHLDLLTDHGVETVLHELVDEVPGELDSTLEGWNCPWSPALVHGPVFFCAADCKGRHLVQEERVAVIVKNDNRDVRLVFPHPVLAGNVAVEERLPFRRVA